ncbi:MAG: 30S ribosomal protein S16 [Flavobacteriales bacterium]|nr:30S ribosomal protein S16 [Flavobacteriales bacterium]
MATKIRLQRHGKKGKPFFHIVAADTRAKRDGRYIERLGSYNPNTNPATIDVDFDRCLSWLKTGAERTDTANAILKYKGVVYKYHLDRGVLKGAMTQDQADAKFDKWMKEKDAKLEGQVGNIAKALDADEKARFKAETEVKETRAKAIMAKTSELAAAAAAEVAAENAPEETTEDTPTAEASTEEAPATEVVAEEATPVAEVKEEAPTEEVKTEEAPVAEAVTEAVKEETPATETAPVEEAKKEAPEVEAKTEEAPAEEKKEEAAE